MGKNVSPESIVIILILRIEYLSKVKEYNMFSNYQ